MAILLQNKILEAAEQKIESGLTPENQADYKKVVVAGMHAAMAKGPNGILASLSKSKDPVNDCAVGAVHLALIMRKQTHNTMPLKSMVPGAMTLMLQALDFCDKSGIAKIGNAELVRATHVFTNTVFKAFKITPNMINVAATKVHSAMQDPAKMELLKRQAGLVKHPDAPGSSEPTLQQPTEPHNGV